MAMTAHGEERGGTTDLKILRALRSGAARWVSGTELASELGLTRAAIWARIRELRARGYAIAASPRRGYCLESSPDLLMPDDLLARLGATGVIGREIQVFREIRSTNDLVERLAVDGVREGVVVFAEAQTQGRGRLGRRWVSPAGRGLWFSVLLRPALLPGEMTRLTILAANAVARVLPGFGGSPVEIKWPNDILVRGRKVAGILTEVQAELDRVRHAILGIGINVNLEASDFPPELRSTATSLRMESGGVVDRAALAVAVLRALDEDYRKLREGRFGRLAEEWAGRCSTLGREVTIRVGQRVIVGRAESLEESGALRVRTEHGRLEAVIGGEVTLLH